MTSVEITVELVEQLIAEQFPQWARLPVAPVKLSGWDNRTFHLGASMTVRLPSASHYADAVEREQRWLPVLASQLPLPIPKPLAMGKPDAHYPWRWSVYQWLEGEVATRQNISDLDRFAYDLANFLRRLQSIDPTDGPTRKLRGGSLAMYDEQARQAMRKLQRVIDTERAAQIWEEALSAPIAGAPVWYHGDVAAGNLLVQEGRLGAVIDFGGIGVGDPACDMTIAWTLLTPAARLAFREALEVEDAIWLRGRGWALWKGMIVMAKLIATNVIEASASQYAVGQVLVE